jgi:hypothetical protein
MLLSCRGKPEDVVRVRAQHPGGRGLLDIPAIPDEQRRDALDDSGPPC